VLADVARRATSFWSRRASHPPAHGVGRHRALQTSEDDTHADDTATSPPPSVPPSRSSTPVPGQPRTGPYARTADPFSDPVGSASSLFVNAQPIAITTDIGASSSFVALEDSGSTTTLSSAHPTSKLVAAPAPLDLPKPRSPPPRTATPHANRPPEPFPRPDSRMSRTVAEGDEEEKPVQWWTDWLCGCSEGPDRGGEVQVRPLTYVYSGPATLSNATGWPDKPPRIVPIVAPFLTLLNDDSRCPFLRMYDTLVWTLNLGQCSILYALSGQFRSSGRVISLLYSIIASIQSPYCYKPDITARAIGVVVLLDLTTVPYLTS
jgi:hypothetical protein